MPTWYDTLAKPPVTPPKKVFGPVWSLLYLLIFASLLLFFSAPQQPLFMLTCALLVVHFTASFNWTRFFFGQKRIRAAFIDILVIDATLLCIIPLFYQASTAAALLLLPYLAWTLFATWLNYAILRLNPDTPAEE